MVNGVVGRRAIHSETPAIPENETFRRNRSMLMAEQWPQKQLDNSTSGGGNLCSRTWLFAGSPPRNRPTRHSSKFKRLAAKKTKIKSPVGKSLGEAGRARGRILLINFNVAAMSQAILYAAREQRNQPLSRNMHIRIRISKSMHAFLR